MTAQTVYRKGQTNGLPGLIGDIGPSYIDTFFADGVTVPYGVFVQRSANNGITVGGAAAIGATIRRSSENSLGAGFEAGSYPPASPVGVMRAGLIWVQFTGPGGSPGDVVTTNGLGQVIPAGTGSALSRIKAVIEIPAVNSVTQEPTGLFIGLVRITEI